MDASILVSVNSINYEKKEDPQGISNGAHAKIDNNYGKPNNYNYYNEDNYNRQLRYGNSYKNNDNYGDNHKNDNTDNDNTDKNVNRLRCSKIATRNESDCTTCCKLAARKDRSISRVIFLIFNYFYMFICRMPSLDLLWMMIKFILKQIM